MKNYGIVAGRVFLLAALLALVPALPALAHSGSLDTYGYHHDRRLGGYQWHQELLAKRAFESEATMAQISPHWLQVQKLGRLVR